MVRSTSQSTPTSSYRAGSAGAVDMGNRPPDDSADRFHDLPDTVPGAGAEVEHVVPAAPDLLPDQPLHRAQMGVGQIRDMDVVAHARAVVRRIIRSVHDPGGAQTQCRVDRERQEMGLRIVSLADPEQKIARPRQVYVGKAVRDLRAGNVWGTRTTSRRWSCPSCSSARDLPPP